ncbi:hypothetical protein [Rhodococcus qingshengii]|uniref:hypothetical protein n=1 Tax=Rhodococcus qingshengii TaxID=334542 RepID=UPI001BEBB0E1|nr:hypothetical protein [Rhodococcus qingshengii]MBT2273592.1 hypothetical protein [Rhodococcus qingshengii]
MKWTRTSDWPGGAVVAADSIFVGDQRHGVITDRRPIAITITAVQDMDILRGVLGDDQLTFVGYSYGTELGAM